MKAINKSLLKMRFRNLILWVTLYAIGMAFLESSVVVYIRELLYPNGFDFPLSSLDGSLAITEILRELATLIMLLSLACIAGKNFSTGFAWFIYAFAIWDIFYYIFLKLIIGWPESILTWDVLFLIPVTWTGPVLSPLIECLIMIALSLLLILYSEKGIKTKLLPAEWLIMTGGALIVIVAFSWDYTGYILDNYSLADIWNLPGNRAILEYATGYIPRSFNWMLFAAGNILIISAIILIYRRFSRSR